MLILGNGRELQTYPSDWQPTTITKGSSYKFLKYVLKKHLPYLSLPLHCEREQGEEGGIEVAGVLVNWPDLI
jgi:hypothetical protein